MALCGFDVPVFGVSPRDEGDTALIFCCCVGTEYVVSLVVACMYAGAAVGAGWDLCFGGDTYVDILAGEVAC